MTGRRKWKSAGGSWRARIGEPSSSHGEIPGMALSAALAPLIPGHANCAILEAGVVMVSQANLTGG